jgi:ribosomal protein L31E
VTRTKTTNPRKRVGRRSPKSKKLGPSDPERNRCFQANQTRLELGLANTGKQFEPKQISQYHPRSLGIVRYKTSNKWASPHRTKSVNTMVPYIDRVGQIHGTSVSTWKCNPYQLYATISSTVHKRLCNVVRGLPRKYRARSALLMKIALIYTITEDNTWFRRCLAMAKRCNKNLRSFVYYKEKHLDTDKRFLIGQALQAALWLQSRTRKCKLLRVRVQSRNKDSGTECQSHDIRFSASDMCTGYQRLDRIMTTWASVYTGQCDHQYDT